MAMEFTLQFNHLEDVAKGIKRSARQIVTKAASDFQARLVNDLTGPRSGVIYGEHQASAPGEAPAWDLGNLANSVTTEVLSDDAAIVTVGAEYGADLEYGTSRIQPRPWVTPAADAFAKELEDLGLTVLRKNVT